VGQGPSHERLTVAEQCPVCGEELPDPTEAWLHLREAHAGAPPRSAAPPPSAPAPPSPSTPSGGIWRQGYANAPATMIVIAVTVGVWVLHLVLRSVAHVNTDLTLSANGRLGTDGQWWRLVTPVVVHFGLIHLAFNMAWVYQLGPPVERLLGKVGFVVAYLSTAVAGDICSDLVYWHKNIESGGASGAVYGLGGIVIGAWLVAKLLDRMASPNGPPGALQFNDQAVRSLAIFFGLYLIIGSAFGPVDSAAHFGGGVLGLVIGGALAWYRNGPRVRTMGRPA
jgi:GlpG protein